MPSYHMLPYVGLCGGCVRAVGTRVGFCQLAMGVHMVIQVTPAKYSSFIILEIATDEDLNKVKYFVTSRLTRL